MPRKPVPAIHLQTYKVNRGVAQQTLWQSRQEQQPILPIADIDEVFPYGCLFQPYLQRNWIPKVDAMGLPRVSILHEEPRPGVGQTLQTYFAEANRCTTLGMLRYPDSELYDVFVLCVRESGALRNLYELFADATNINANGVTVTLRTFVLGHPALPIPVTNRKLHRPWYLTEVIPPLLTRVSHSQHSSVEPSAPLSKHR